ncbi:Centrosomal protein of [Trichinella pseudospiralis]
MGGTTQTTVHTFLPIRCHFPLNNDAQNLSRPESFLTKKACKMFIALGGAFSKQCRFYLSVILSLKPKEPRTILVIYCAICPPTSPKYSPLFGASFKQMWTIFVLSST